MTPVVASCPCGEVYELKPEYAGRLLECSACGRHLRAGPALDRPRPTVPGVDPAFDRDVFLLRQRVAITSKYEVCAEDGTPVVYVERPTYPLRTLLAWGLGFMAASFVFGRIVMGRGPDAEPGAGVLLDFLGGLLAAAAFVVVSMSARPLRHVTVYRDESRREVLLRIFQDQRIALMVRTYTVVTATGEPLGRLSKHYIHNVVRKRWYVEAPGGARLAMAIEDSIVLSLLRRVIGTLFGALRTNFLLVGPDGQSLGEFNRKLTLLDRYLLDLSDDPGRVLDRRIALALGVMLDTGERR